MEGEVGCDENDERTTDAQENCAHDSIEGNVVCSLFVLITAVVLDALCALPGALLSDVPASLRTTSLVLTVLLGSPSISKTKKGVLEQRVVLAALLGVAAFFGLNKAETSARNADALFSLFGTLACVVACSTNGVMLRSDTHAKQRESREHLSALTGALLFYVGMRCMRNAFALPGDILAFSVSHAEFDVRGFGIANDVTVAGLAFSGCIISAFGIIVLLNHDTVLHTGSNGLSSVSAILACCAFVGAFAVQISTYSLIEQLPALFGDASCDGGYQYCRAAHRARRLFVATNNSSSSFTGAISIAVFAFSNTAKFTNRRSYFTAVTAWNPTTTAAVVAFAVSMFTVLSFTDTRSMNYSDVELLLLLISIPAAILSMPALACTFHIAGQSIYVLTRVYSSNGFSWLYFTHHSVAATLVLTIAVLALSSASYLMYNLFDGRLYVESIETLTGVLLTMLVSVQLFLTLATMCMSSGYTGVQYVDDKGSWRVSGYEFAVQHSVSFFFSAALYAGRYEHALLGNWVRLLGWFLVPPLLAISWAFCVFSLRRANRTVNMWTWARLSLA